MKKKILSAALSSLMASSAVPAYVNAADDTNAMPKWVPQAYDDCAEFMNKYGKTFVKDDLVCFIDISERGTDYVLDYDVDSTVWKPENRAVYSPDNTKHPDEMPNYDYNVFCFRLNAGDSLGFSRYNAVPDINELPHQYTFEADETGKVTETDFYSFVPDCIIEYNDFVLKNGVISAVNDTVVMCGTYNPSLGIFMLPETYGKGTLEAVGAERISYYRSGALNADGASINSIYVYKPVHSGTVCAGLIKLYKADGKRQYMENWFSIDDAMEVTEIDEKEFFDDNRGDVNGDGRLTIADVWVFEQWLMGSQKRIPANLKAADLCTDGVYDVYDLILLKKELLNSEDPPQPVTGDYVYSDLAELKKAVNGGITEEELTAKGEDFAEALTRIREDGLPCPMEPGINFNYDYTYRRVALHSKGLCGLPSVSLYPVDLSYIDCIQIAPIDKNLCRNVDGVKLKVIISALEDRDLSKHKSVDITFAEGKTYPALLGTRDDRYVTFIMNSCLVRIVYDPEKCDGKNFKGSTFEAMRMK